MDYRLLGFDEFDPATLYEALRLRVDVFVVEQHCPYPELDGRDLDPGARHLLGSEDGRLLAYCRLLPAGVGHAAPSIGRVVVDGGARGRGLAHALMDEALRQCARLWPGQAIELGAQAHLEAFYAAHGFVVASEPYDEDGIPHVLMRRAA